MARPRLRLWLLGGVALVLVAGAVAAQQLLPLRSFLGLTAEGGCTPTLASTRLPGNRASDDGHWEHAEPYPERRDEVRAATAEEAIYVGTGLTLEDGRLVPVDELFSFEPAGGTYETLPGPPVPVDHAALVEYQGDLYVIGGFVDDRPTSAVWRYSQVSGEWDELAPLGVPRASPAAAVIGERIYVVGGARGPRGDAEVALPTLEVYDIGAGTWSRGPDMPTARHHHGAAARDGRLVVVGGRGNSDLSLDAVEEYDPTTRRWTTLASLPVGVGGVAVVGAGGSVIAIGGGDDDEQWVTPATWELATGASEWRRLADLNVARHGHGAAVLGSTVYVFAGAPCPGYGRSDEVESLTVEPVQG